MVLAGQRHCPGTLEMFTEKRKVGGSTPPLTTSDLDDPESADLRKRHHRFVSSEISD
jgi:hypothetical protein